MAIWRGLRLLRVRLRPQNPIGGILNLIKTFYILKDKAVPIFASIIFNKETFSLVREKSLEKDDEAVCFFGNS